MSGITVELSELDADLWEAFKRGGAWVAHSEYMRVVAENAKLRSQCADLVDERERLFQANVEKNGEVLRLVAENAKLREDNDCLIQAIENLHNVSLEDKLVQLENSNDKLRELVRDYERCTMHADCDKCEYDGTTSTHCPLSPCFPDIDELNELGIEVAE